VIENKSIKNSDLKSAVHDFWQENSCGEIYAKGIEYQEQLESQSRERYILEPHIFELACFNEGKGRDVLEIGVGMGADHLEWANADPKSLSGIDITLRVINFTRSRLELYGFI